MSWAFDSTPSRISRGLSWRSPLHSLSCPLLTVSFSFLCPSPLRESYSTRPLSCLFNPITKHLDDRSVPRPCVFQQSLQKEHSSGLSQLFTDKGSLLRLVTFPEASTFSVALKRTMASPPCWLSGLSLSSLPPSS